MSIGSAVFSDIVASQQLEADLSVSGASTSGDVRIEGGQLHYKGESFDSLAEFKDHLDSNIMGLAAVSAKSDQLAQSEKNFREFADKVEKNQLKCEDLQEVLEAAAIKAEQTSAETASGEVAQIQALAESLGVNLVIPDSGPAVAPLSPSVEA